MNCLFRFISAIVMIHMVVVVTCVPHQNWFFQGSVNDCKNYTNSTMHCKNLTPVSSLHIYSTSYYQTNISDIPQNISLWLQNKDGNKTNNILNLQISFKNNFNHLCYFIKDNRKRTSLINGTVALPYRDHNVILGITFNLSVDFAASTLTFSVSTQGSHGKIIFLVNYYLPVFAITTHPHRCIWTLMNLSSCADNDLYLNATEVSSFSDTNKGTIHPMYEEFFYRDVLNTNPTIETDQAIHLSSRNCKELGPIKHRDSGACSSIDLKEGSLNFNHIPVELLKYISMKIKGTEGQIDMRRDKHDESDRLHLSFFTKEENMIQLSLDQVNQQEIMIPRNTNLERFSIIIIFSTREMLNCEEVLSQVYLTTWSNATTYIGTLRLPIANTLENPFGFQIMGDVDLVDVIAKLEDSRKVNATPCGITEVASLPTISRRGRFAGEWDLTHRINLNDINSGVSSDSQPTQYTVLYLTVFAVSLAAIASVIGTAYKVGQKQKERKYWKSIKEVSVATIQDHSMTIEHAEISRSHTSITSPSAGRKISTSIKDAISTKLEVPSINLQRSATIRRKSENSKTLNDTVRPHSILSVVELSVEDTKEFISTESRHSLQLGATGMEATSLVNPSSFGTLSLSHHGSNSNYYSSFQENRTGLGHYRSEDDILNRCDDPVANKYIGEIESIDTLDPDEFFGCTHTVN